MKRLLAILCTILLFSNSFAIPVENEVQTRGLISDVIGLVWNGISVITQTALSLFSRFLGNIGTLVNGAVTSLSTLANDALQALSNTAQLVVQSLSPLLEVPAIVGTAVQKALSNSSPRTGLSTITNQLNNLVNAVSTAINVTSTLVPQIAAQVQGDVAQLIALRDAILKNVTAAAQAATSGLNFLFPKPLVNVLGDPTLSNIQELLAFGSGILNNVTQALVAAVQNNPFITFVNDIIVAPTRTALQSALTALQTAVSQIIGAAVQAVNGTITNALGAVSQLIPTALSRVNTSISRLNQTISAAISQATTLSTAARTAAQQQLQSVIGNLTLLVGGLQSNLTTALQNVTKQLLSEAQTSLAVITTLAQNLTGQVITALNSSSTPAAALALQVLTGLQPVIKDGLGGLVNCTTQQVTAVQTLVQTIGATVNGTQTEVRQTVQGCLSLSTEAEIISCFQANITSQFPQLVQTVQTLIGQVIQASPASFEACVTANELRVAKALAQLAGSLIANIG